MAVASKLPSLTASFRSNEEIPPYRFVEAGEGSGVADVSIDSQSWFAKTAQASGTGVIGTTGIKGIAAKGVGEVFVSGIVLVEADSSVEQGDLIMSAQDGRAKPLDGNAAESVCGVCITGGVEGSVIAVKLR